MRREITKSYLVQFDAVALCGGAVIHVSHANCPITMPDFRAGVAIYQPALLYHLTPLLDSIFTLSALGFDVIK